MILLVKLNENSPENITRGDASSRSTNEIARAMSNDNAGKIGCVFRPDQKTQRACSLSDQSRSKQDEAGDTGKVKG